MVVSAIEKIVARGDQLDDLGERSGLYSDCTQNSE